MLRVVDLSSATEAGPEPEPASPPGVVVAVGSAADIARDEYWLQAATFTLTEDPGSDRGAVTVDSVPEALAELTQRYRRWPHASRVCDDVLRAVDPRGPTLAGVVTESLAYSTLQAGPEVGGRPARSSGGVWPNAVRPACPTSPTRCWRGVRATPCGSPSTGRNATTRFPPMRGPRCSRR